MMMPPQLVPGSPNAPWTTAPTAMHLQQIAAARQLGARVRRAQSVALFSAWTTAVFAFLTMLMSIFSIPGLLLGAGIAVISIIEFQSAGQLRKLDRCAPRRLAINQIALAAILFAYGALSLWSSLRNPSELETQISGDPQLRQMLGDLPGLMTSITIAVYAGVMLAALIGPGLTALYYWTRTKYIDAYVSQTPQWILDLQRAGLSL